MEIRPNSPTPETDISRNFVETFELTQGLGQDLGKHIPPSGTLMPIDNEYSAHFSSPSTKTTNVLSHRYFNQ